jgi:hypothetical protein
MFAFEKDPRRGKALLQRLRLLCGFEETRRPRGAKGKCLGQEMDWFANVLGWLLGQIICKSEKPQKMIGFTWIYYMIESAQKLWFKPNIRIYGL